MNLALRRMRSAEDEALSLRGELTDAKDNVAAGRAAFGEHHMTISLRANSPEEVDEGCAEVQAALADLGILSVREDIAIEPAIPILASPSWRGVDGFPWRAIKKSSGESVFIKVMDRDAELYIDIPCAFEAAQRASDLGIGPKVMLADVPSGILIMEDLNHGWRVGGLERWADPADAPLLRDALGTALPPGVAPSLLEPIPDPLGRPAEK